MNWAASVGIAFLILIAAHVFSYVWGFLEKRFKNSKPLDIKEANRPRKPEADWSDNLERWVLPGDMGREARMRSLERKIETLENALTDSLVVVYSRKTPPDAVPAVLLAANDVAWCEMAEGSMRSGMWHCNGGTWEEIGDRRYGSTKHALLQNGSTLLGITSVSALGMAKFSKVVENRSRDGNIAKSQLPDTWVRWLDKMEPEAQEAICRLMSITQDVKRDPAPEGRRRIDLGD